MILTRFGNKRRMAHYLNNLFPEHRMRVELFFGAGGSYFYLPKPQYSILNDLDDDVTNLYRVIIKHSEELKKQIEILPISETNIKYWKANKETDPLMKAVRFLFLSNFTYLGKGDTLRLGLDNAKKTLLNSIEPTLQYLQNVKITNRDFREVLNKISWSKGLNDKENCFVYLDPCYLDTENTYKVSDWTIEDSTDCLDLMVSCGIKSGMSEFNHPEIIRLAKERGLFITEVCNRSNIKNKRIEIFISNYTINTQQTLFESVY